MRRMRRLLRTRREERPSNGRTSKGFDEIAASHYSPEAHEHAEQTITAGICDWRNGVSPTNCTAAILDR
jgi:hypothetical protein